VITELVSTVKHHACRPARSTEVRDHFQHAARHFVNARIRNFLPILIERAVKAKLT
jgi:hypothetical protein